MRLGRATSGSIIHADLHKSNNKLVSVKLECRNPSFGLTTKAKGL